MIISNAFISFLNRLFVLLRTVHFVTPLLLSQAHFYHFCNTFLFLKFRNSSDVVRRINYFLLYSDMASKSIRYIIFAIIYVNDSKRQRCVRTTITMVVAICLQSQIEMIHNNVITISVVEETREVLEPEFQFSNTIVDFVRYHFMLLTSTRRILY